MGWRTQDARGTMLLDKSFLIDALTDSKRQVPALCPGIDRGERMSIPSVVLYEWLRGPRSTQELVAQDVLLPSKRAIDFGPEEARVAASLYQRVGRPRSREIDLAIAACAIVHVAEVGTLNQNDIDDISGLHVWCPR